jgi:hypothetical protein
MEDVNKLIQDAEQGDAEAQYGLDVCYFSSILEI